MSGVHLDRRSTMAGAVRVEDEIRRQGREALFSISTRPIPGAVPGDRDAGPPATDIHLMLHSLAFGTLKPFLAESPLAASGRRTST